MKNLLKILRKLNLCKIQLDKMTVLSISCIPFVYICVLFLLKQAPVNYEKIANKITYYTAQKLRKEKNLFLIGIGGGMMDSIRLMAMKFQYLQEVDLITARQLVTNAAKDYLSAINSSEKIRPYLKNYPFTLENIEITIFFLTPDRNYLAFGEIECVDCTHGVVKYYVRNETDIIGEPFLQETYEEALKSLAKSESR